MSDIKRQPTPHPNQVKDATGNITYRHILTVYDVPMSDTNLANRYRLWVVQWTNGQFPVLEKRRIYVCKDGRERTYKQMGLSMSDMVCVADKWKEIQQALQS